MYVFNFYVVSKKTSLIKNLKKKQMLPQFHSWALPAPTHTIWQQAIYAKGLSFLNPQKTFKMAFLIFSHRIFETSFSINVHKQKQMYISWNMRTYSWRILHAN